ncbi:MAG: hypothetical protein ACR2HB_07620 [Dehalococcoidia bacterium]
MSQISAKLSAQALPPDRFFGTAKINGQEQPEGTVVEAYVNGTLCGSGTVLKRNDMVIYFVDVLGGGQKPGCAGDGDTVTFRVAGLDAAESGTYQTGTATRLDLTASGAAAQVAAPTVLPPEGGGTPAVATVFIPLPNLTAVPGAATPIAQTPAAVAAPSVSPVAPRASASATATAATGTGSAATALPSATATAVAAASPSTTPTTPATGSPTATGTPGSSPTEAAISTAAIGSATATALRPAIATPAAAKSNGTPAAVWIGGIVAALIIIGGILGWLYQRREAP